MYIWGDGGMACRWKRSHLQTFSFQPHLIGVDDVLPKHVCARTDRGNGVKVHLRHPNGQNCILLSQSLSAGHCVVVVLTNTTSHHKLNNAHQQCYQRHYYLSQMARSVLLKNKDYCSSRYDAQSQ